MKSEHDKINERIAELIHKFKNGNERYATDSYVNKVINVLARRGDPIELLDQILEINSNLMAENIELHKKLPFKIMGTNCEKGANIENP